MFGKRMSEETKQKLRESMKAHHKKRKMVKATISIELF